MITMDITDFNSGMRKERKNSWKSRLIVPFGFSRWSLLYHILQPVFCGYEKRNQAGRSAW